MNNNLVKSETSAPHCYSHECQACGKKLHVYKWYTQVITMAIAFLLFYGAMLLVDLGTGGGIYTPRCWVKDDLKGFTTHEGQTVPALKQFPIRCEDFFL